MSEKFKQFPASKDATYALFSVASKSAIEYNLQNDFIALSQTIEKNIDLAKKSIDKSIGIAQSVGEKSRSTPLITLQKHTLQIWKEEIQDDRKIC